MFLIRLNCTLRNETFFIMASGHETNFINEQNNSYPCEVVLGCNFNDSSLPQEENAKSSFNSNKDSQHLFRQQHGNDPTLSQNVHSSQHQPLIYGEKPQNLSNVPESSQSMCHQSLENVLGMVHDKWPETRFSGNEDAVSHNPSGAEFIVIQNNHSFGQDLYAPQTSDIHGSHPPTIQYPSANQQFFSEELNFSENRSNTTQQMHTQTELDANGFSWTQSSYPSVQQFAERNTSRVQGYDSLPRKQPWNEPIDYQIPYQLSHYFHGIGGSSKIQDLPSQSFQNSVYRSENIQSSYPQGIRQSESERNLINMHSSSDLASRIKFSQDCGFHSSTRRILNQTTSNQDLHSRNIQPVEKETHDNPELHCLPLTFTEYANKHNLPNLLPELQFKRGPYTILLAESLPNTLDTCLLGGNSLKIDRFMNKKRIISSQQASAKFIREEYVNLKRLHRYLNRSEFITILVYGPPNTTRSFLQTYAGRNKLEFFDPCSFAFDRNYRRCGILMMVSIRRMYEMNGSIPLLKSRLSRRSTIMYVLDTMNTDDISVLTELMNTLRWEMRRDIPVILVKRKRGMGISDNEEDNVKEGFKLKAKYNLSAYLEYSSDSKAEAEDVMLTALDVSFL